MKHDPLFLLEGKTAAVTGGGGVLGGAMAGELARRGVRVAILDRREESASRTADAIRAEGGAALPVPCDVLDRADLEKAAAAADSAFGRVEILVNAAGGNRKEATTSETRAFFDLPADALRAVIELNLLGTVLPSQVFGRRMADAGEGAIVNISSMNAFRPLTRIAGYSAAKAAVNNFTQWLAVDLARNVSPRIRVNAIAPGFFETDQNRFLLRAGGAGDLTERGREILGHTPMNRFGAPEDLFGALVWLASPASAFVTGTVIPVDGGFSAYSGV